MPPKKTKPKYTTWSCQLCPELDCDDMVACDECEKWFHFDCVGVTSEIKHKSWSCDRCKKTTKKSSIENLDHSSSKVSSMKIPASARAAFSMLSSHTSVVSSRKKVPSKASTMTSRQKAIALEKLEEEQRIKLDILNRKYQILKCSSTHKSSDDDESAKDQFDQDLERDSLEYTRHWAKKVQERVKVYPKKGVSITSSDEEREQLNNCNPAKVAQQSATLSKETSHEKQVPVLDKNKQSTLLDHFKKFREQQSNFGHSGIESSEKQKIRPQEMKADKTCKQLVQVQLPEGQLRKVNLDECLMNVSSQSDVYQERMGFDQNVVMRPELNTRHTVFDSLNPTLQQPTQFGFISSDNKLTSTTNSSMNVQPSMSNWFGTGSVPSDQFRQSNFGFEASNTQDSHQTAVKVPKNQQPANCFANGSNSQQQTNVKFQPSFGLRNLSQQQPGSLGFGNAQANQGLCSANISPEEGSGYVGYVGPLTQAHIAARHTYSKDLPQFYGSPEEWPMFLSALMNSTEACGFTDGDNLGRLQRCLKGDAKATVQSRLLHAKSVPGVVETLYLLFGRPSLIIYKLLEKINKTPPPKAEDLNSMVKFAIAVQNLCATIESSGSLEYLRNPILVQSLTDKLPTQIQLNWAYFKHSVGNVDLSVMGKWLYQLAIVATEVINPATVKVFLPFVCHL